MHENRTAIITGAGGAIGRAIAMKLAAESVSIVVADVDIKQARETAEMVEVAGAPALAVKTDVRNIQEIRQMVNTALDKYQHIDILVNNAGGGARGEMMPFHLQDVEVLNWVLDVNLKGAMFCTREVLGHMIEKNDGNVVNIGSILGLQGLEKYAEYAAAKGGLIAMTKSLAKEVGGKGININCVSPGWIPREEENVDKDQALSRTYINRVGRPEDVGELVSFLVSEKAAFITGQNYIIDGGRSLGLRGN